MHKQINYDDKTRGMVSQQIRIKLVALDCYHWIEVRSTQKLMVIYWFPSTLEKMKSWNLLKKVRHVKMTLNHVSKGF